MTGVAPYEWAARIESAEKAGDLNRAITLTHDAIVQHPRSADLRNLGGNLRLRQGDVSGAADWFTAAARLEPARLDLAVNAAIALSRQGNHSAARAMLMPHENLGRHSAIYCSTRGTVERGAGRLADAALWYDRAIAIEPGRMKALHGAARVALERGQADAATRFDKALTVNPGSLELWLGKAQALNAQGAKDSAFAIAEQLAAKAPQFIDGLRFHAQLRSDRGDASYDQTFDAAARLAPDDPDIPAAHIALLTSVERYADAAEVAARSRRTFGDRQFALLEATARDAAGQYDEARGLLDRVDLPAADIAVDRSRNALRTGKIDEALAHLDVALHGAPWDQQAWALRLVGWRLIEDRRIAWLLGEGTLARPIILPDGDAVINRAASLLDRLHDNSAFPLGQSLRGGTQTRGNLFDRAEKALSDLKQAIYAALANYRKSLPPTDLTHPFLRHRDAPWAISGSWSVRLLGGGHHHASHIHPGGVLSSALYLRVPEIPTDPKTQAGWLELGRPPANLNIDLKPLAMIEPKAGMHALFPSLIFHGTRPFTQGARMSVAFDVLPDTEDET